MPAHLAVQSSESPSRGLELAGIEELERPDDPLPVGGLDLVRRPRRSFRQVDMKGLRTSALELG